MGGGEMKNFMFDDVRCDICGKWCIDDCLVKGLFVCSEHCYKIASKREIISENE